MKMSKTAIAVLVMASAAPAWAHHSFAAYDMTKTQTAEATIKEFHWGAPHSSAVFTIKNPDGTTQEITLQGGAPAAMSRAGFQPKDMKRGEKVEIVWHPLRNNSPGGALSSIRFSDGRVFKDT